jgi:hypothetical protein
MSSVLPVTGFSNYIQSSITGNVTGNVTVGYTGGTTGTFTILTILFKAYVYTTSIITPIITNDIFGGLKIRQAVSFGASIYVPPQLTTNPCTLFYDQTRRSLMQINDGM